MADGLRMEETTMKPGDINEDGKEIEQDGDITWEQGNESKGISKTIRGSEQTGTRL